ncbi:MAG: photosystem II cytochrome PsbV2 [Chroococcidiopsidaceae cyanobacterium CP_BM_ER_R8_30]|nr:photosystem II cytochrome PsbV2 [Chroococcidiopsidaceae cyanobacterium CP_BM_ER_R8_30]
MRLFCKIYLVTLLLVVSVMLQSLPALAASIDPYVARYLHVTEPIALEMNEQGETRPFSPQELAQGKELFENNCMNCHVGGATLPDPLVSLSLTKLKGANPPRNNINNLVAYLRRPTVYDGSEETFWCRQVPESWLSQEQVESLAAFVLTAAQKAPGWGAETF